MQICSVTLSERPILRFKKGSKCEELAKQLDGALDTFEKLVCVCMYVYVCDVCICVCACICDGALDSFEKLVCVCMYVYVCDVCVYVYVTEL